jgi:hypothetical protein
LHTYEQSAAVTGAAGPLLDVAINGLPSPEIKIAYAKVGSVGDLERIAEGRKKGLRYIVENAWHTGASADGFR